MAAENGVVDELPIAHLEDESAVDMRTMLDMMYPKTNQIAIRLGVVLSECMRR